MYAIVDICGKQYKVEKDITLNVDRIINQAEGDLVLDKVLLYSNGENVMVGQPYLSNVKIKAKLLKEIKGKKVRGVKFKKRKNYTRTMGHRQTYSQLKIDDVIVN